MISHDQNRNLLGLLLFCICICQPQPSEADSVQQLLAQRRMQRTIQDIAEIDFTIISTDQSWVVAKVTALKPYATTPGAYINGDTGQVVMPVNPRLAFFVRGSIQVLVQLSGTTTPHLTYEWQRNTSDPEDLRFSPFRHGGTTIMRINSEKSDATQLQPVYLIPDQWVSFAGLSVKSVQAKTSILSPKTAPVYRKQLEALLSDPNPFVAIAAAHTLEQAQLLDANFIQNYLLTSTSWKRSAFTYLLLQQLPDDKILELPDAPLTDNAVRVAVNKALSDEPLTDALRRVIDNAKDAVTLHEIAFGISATSQRTIISIERVKRLLHRVDVRRNLLGTHTQADTDLNVLLSNMGVLTPVTSTPTASKTVLK